MAIVADLQKRLLALENDWTGLDAIKMKHDVNELVQQAPNFVTSKMNERLTEDVKLFRTNIATINFEIQSTKDLHTNQEKVMETNMKDIKEKF